MKVRTMIMIGAMCFAIIPMVIYAIYAGIVVQNDGLEAFQSQIVDITKNEATTLQTLLDTVQSDIKALANTEEIESAAKAGTSSDDAGEILVRFTNENANVSYAYLVDSDGNIFGGKDNGKELDNFEKYAEYKDNVLYINDISASVSSSVSTMFIKQTIGDSMLLLGYDISSSDNFISKITDNATFYNQGRVIIVDSRMNWASGTGYNNNLESQYTSAVTSRISSLEDNVATDLITYSGTNGSNYACMIRVGGEDGLIALVSCPANKSGILSGQATSPIVLVVVLLSIICIVGAIVVSIAITRPLKTIEETLVKIRRGDHEARINTVSNNEYGQISRQFNNLVDEIVVSEDRYRTITDMSDNIIFEWNFKTNEVFFSNNFNKKFSYRAPSDHFGDSFLLKAKIHPDDVERYRSDLDKLEKGNSFERNEYRIKNIYGDFIWVLMRTATLHDKEGKPLKVVGVMVDIDRAKKSEQQLTARASFDALTELYNRETVESQINNEISLSEARKSEMAVLFIDVDDFKHFNDNYSHATGDQVLKFVAKTIQGVVEEFGFAGRYGGDEFIACIRNSEVNNPSLSAQQIIDRLDKGFDTDSGEHLTVSVSIGIAVIKDDYNTRVEYLIGKADDAMYSVKKSGKSNYAYIQ